jgi:hypothetical protein
MSLKGPAGVTVPWKLVGAPMLTGPRFVVAAFAPKEQPATAKAQKICFIFIALPPSEVIGGVYDADLIPSLTSASYCFINQCFVELPCQRLTAWPDEHRKIGTRPLFERSCFQLLG